MVDARTAARAKEDSFRLAASERGEKEKPLFEMKANLTKDEKKAAAAAKRVELAAKKAARKGDGVADDAEDGVGEAEAEEVEEPGASKGAEGEALSAGAARKAAKAAKAAKLAEVASITAGAGEITLSEEQKRVASSRACTGVLASSSKAWDVKFDSFSLAVGGNALVNDCAIELTQGCRYGLIGDNGSGKSNVLAAIATRELPLPPHVDVFLLHEEAPPTEQTGVEAVIAHVVEEVNRLEAYAETLLEEAGPDDERLQAIYERLEQLDPTGAEPRARKILAGLGFADHLVPMDRATKHMSGGWRMRVSLAKALFARCAKK